MKRLLMMTPALLSLLACGKPTCPTEDLDCLFGSMIWRDLAGSSSSDVFDPPQTLYPLSRAAMERHLSTTPPPGGARLESGTSSFELKEVDDGALLMLTWSDPLGCRPSFCMSACPKGVRCVGGARCSPTLRDGLTSGTTFHWVTYEKAPETSSTFDMQIIGVSAPGCPENVAPLIEADDPGLLYTEVVTLDVRVAGKNDKPDDEGGGTCAGGWVGSTLACTPLGPGGSCVCNGSASTCITRTEYESVTGRAFPAACFPRGTTGCLDTAQGTLVKPCCENLRCVVTSKCGGGSAAGGVCQ